jgi:hypothetical protein
LRHYQLSSSVESQIQTPDILQGTNRGFNYTLAENDEGVRLAESDLMVIEDPIIEAYDLCSYNIKYCK